MKGLAAAQRVRVLWCALHMIEGHPPTGSRTIVVRLAKHWPSLLSLKLQPNGCLYA